MAKNPDKLRSLRNDLKIDKTQLHIEWEHQPELYRLWAEQHALSVLEKDRAKEKLELIDADLDLDIRYDPKIYHLEKLAESSIKSTIKIQPEHIDAQKELDRAKYKVVRMQAAKDAMEHRRDALKNLTKLALAGFYSANPTIPAEIEIEHNKISKKEFSNYQWQKRGLIK